MFTNIKNGLLARRYFVLHPWKKTCENFLEILWNEGFILGYTNCFEIVNKKHKNKKKFTKILLKYNNGDPVINKIKLISKPSRKIYCKNKQLWKINSNKFIIFSTNKGLKTLDECKKLKLGGEAYIIIE